jgi:hypothetical protein
VIAVDWPTLAPARQNRVENERMRAERGFWMTVEGQTYPPFFFS